MIMEKLLSSLNFPAPLFPVVKMINGQKIAMWVKHNSLDYVNLKNKNPTFPYLWKNLWKVLKTQSYQQKTQGFPQMHTLQEMFIFCTFSDIFYVSFRVMSPFLSGVIILLFRVKSWQICQSVTFSPRFWRWIRQNFCDFSTISFRVNFLPREMLWSVFMPALHSLKPHYHFFATALVFPDNIRQKTAGSVEEPAVSL